MIINDKNKKGDHQTKRQQKRDRDKNKRQIKQALARGVYHEKRRKGTSRISEWSSGKVLEVIGKR
jgi:hypothetical protein